MPVHIRQYRPRMDSKDPQNSSNPVRSQDAHNSLDFQEEYLRHQLAKIDKMSIHDLLKTRRTSETEMNTFKQQSPVRQANKTNLQFGVTERYMGERTPGEMWTNIDQQMSDMRSADFHQQRTSRTLNFAKRGRLGIDLYLIAFATLGVIGLPLYFFFVGRDARRKKVQRRNLTPKQIRNLDQYSKENIDDYSQQVIKYFNPQRERARVRQYQLMEQQLRLRKEIEEM